MAITLEIWEDSGTAIGSPLAGTTRQEVNNVGWKDSGLDETAPFVDYPITQPYDGDLYTTSYTKYNYFKMSGTYDYAHELKIQFEGDPAGFGSGSGVAPNVRILYCWTSNYATPSILPIFGTYYEPGNSPIWTPPLSTTGPEGVAVDQGILDPNITYYTPYLVTQLFVTTGAWDDFGNLASTFKLKINLTERKAGLPGFDPALKLWSS